MKDKLEDKPEPLSLKSNMIWNSFGSLFYLGCQWLITVLVVRLSTGFDDAGLLSLATSVVGIFSTFANYKTNTIQVSDIHRDYSFAEYLGFRCITLLIAFAACMVYAFVTCPLYSVATIALYYFYKGLALLIDVLHGEDQLNRRMDYAGKSFCLQGIVSIATFSAALLLFRNLNAAIASMILGEALVLVAYDARVTSSFQAVIPRITISRAIQLLIRTFPAVVASVAASSLLTIPKQYLLQVDGSASLGIYSSIAAPTLIIQMGAQYLYGPLLDIFPRKYFDEGISSFKSLLLRTSASISLVAAVCSLGLMVLGKPVLALFFGEEITRYVYLLQPMLLSTFATAFLWFFGDLMVAIRDFSAYLVGNILALIAVIPLGFFLINQYGMNGVSFAASAASALGVIWMLINLIRDMKKASAPINI